MQSDAFQIYTARLRAALRKGSKTFVINNCSKLRDQIVSFVKKRGETKENNPAITVAGSLIHTLLMVRPWETSYVKTELIPTMSDDYDAWEQDQEMKRLEKELYA